MLTTSTSMKDWLGNNTFELDALGRVTKANNYENKLLQYSYTPTGMKKAITYPDGSSVKYEYDNMDRLTKVIDGQNKLSQYKYDPLGNVLEKNLANGYKTYYKYDELSRLVKFANADASTKIVDSYEFKFDAAGNKTQGLRNGETTNYEYDALNQLTKVTEVGANPTGLKCFVPTPTNTKKYFYDKLGNRVRLETWKNNNLDSAQDYKYDNLDKLLSMTGKGITAPGEEDTLPNGLNMEYDQRGNMVKMTSYDKVTRKDKVIATYTFDATNIMVGSTNRQGEKSTFVYDGAGRRVKTAYEKNMFFGIKKTEQMNYLLDVTKPYDNVLMIEGSETTGKTADNKPLCNWSYQEFIEQKFTYGLEMLSVDKTEKNSFLRKNKFIDRDYYLQDELGSPIKIVDDSGRVEKTYKYDEFGRPVEPRFGMKCDRTDNVFSYTGYQFDAGTGLMYAQARYYMPSAGRFVSEDTYRSNINDVVGLNIYTYCANNPITCTDPTGQFIEGNVLNIGATGDDVRVLQKALVRKGYLVMPKGVEYGYYGNLTVEAVKRYQIENSLDQDGLVGNLTWGAMGLLILSKADALKGVKVATIGCDQYLDVTEPINTVFYNAGVEAAKHAGDLAWFYSMVNHKDPWDIKREDPWEKTVGTTYPGGFDSKVILLGSFSTPEELGNLMYGYTGTSAGFSETTLISGSMYAAGIWNILIDKNSRANEFNDHNTIRKGIQWYKGK